MSVRVEISVTRTVTVEPADLKPGDVVVSAGWNDEQVTMVTVCRTEPASGILASMGLANLDDEIAVHLSPSTAATRAYGATGCT